MIEDKANAHRMWRVTNMVRHPRHMLRLQLLRRSTSKTGYSLQQFENTKSIFIHIPKASGVSIAQSLYGNLGCGHMGMRDYELAFRPTFIRTSYIFTFVRNPWDRLHSAYRFLAKGGMNRADAAWLDANGQYMSSFDHFVEKGLSDPAVARSLHIIPQERFLFSRLHDYQVIDFVGFYENVNEDFAQVSQRLLGQPLPLAHINKTSDAPVDYRSAYCESTRQIVAEFYARDIALFGYDFDGTSIAHQIVRRDAGTLLRP